MSGFAEPQLPRWRCPHCGNDANVTTSKGPGCGRSLCDKLNRALDERDKMHVAFNTLIEMRMCRNCSTCSKHMPALVAAASSPPPGSDW